MTPETLHAAAADEDEDVPPPLPSAPPPAPNWRTFPGQDVTASDASFLDSSSFLVEPGMTAAARDEPGLTAAPRDEPGRLARSGSLDDLDELTQQKLEIVRRKSAFLGLNVYDTDEYKQIKQGERALGGRRGSDGTLSLSLFCMRWLPACWRTHRQYPCSYICCVRVA